MSFPKLSRRELSRPEPCDSSLITAGRQCPTNWSLSNQPMGSVVKLREGWLAKAATMHAVDFDIGRWMLGVWRFPGLVRQ